MNANPAPKTSFLENSIAVAAHAELLKSPAFQNAIQVALLQYSRALHEAAPSNLDGPNYMSAAASCFNRIMGAQEFVNILINLGSKAEPAKRTDSMNLKQN